jgi:pimeloyl-ACP methyl ester carboxylesterase
MLSFNYNGTKIHYSIHGEGKTVVLVHGFGEDGTIWNHQIKFLKQHCKVIVPELPGSGHSEYLPQSNVTVEDYAEIFKALLDELNETEVIFIGHSLGGYITLAFAEKFPNMLRAFGLVHSSAFEDDAEKKASRKKGIRHIQQYGGHSFLKNVIPNLYAPAFRVSHAHLIKEKIKKAEVFTNEALIQYYEAMIARPDRTKTLSGSEVPVLFILGTEDTAAPLKDLLQQVHLPKTSYIHILQDIGHMGMLEATDAVNKHLLQFIKDV